jgi:ABC-type polysaccharide/polyol phosphate export permease
MYKGKLSTSYLKRWKIKFAIMIMAILFGSFVVWYAINSVTILPPIVIGLAGLGIIFSGIYNYFSIHPVNR